ncbi:hypothetical protein TNCV_4924721 [Trichonephila clavipes]|nr:hypothetical protein TNCV_4924721 [Trichonephila clavipes]
MKEVAEESMKMAASKNILRHLITFNEKFGLKINRNVCVPLAERDNRRIFTVQDRGCKNIFEARRAKKIKKSKEIGLFQEHEGYIISLEKAYQRAVRRNGAPDNSSRLRACLACDSESRIGFSRHVLDDRQDTVGSGIRR